MNKLCVALAHGKLIKNGIYKSVVVSIALELHTMVYVNPRSTVDAVLDSELLYIVHFCTSVHHACNGLGKDPYKRSFYNRQRENNKMATAIEQD